MNINTLCAHYLNSIYAKLAKTNSINYPKNYGEFLFPGLAKLFSELNLTKEDVFLDLGSGLGKGVVQAFLHTEVGEARGIELNEAMHQVATRASYQIQQDLPQFFENRKLTFIQGDFLKIPFEGVTVALVNATCFSQSLLHSLGNRINQTSSIHTVLSTRPIPTLTQLIFKKVIYLECSWDSAQCFLYS